jgi:hypothetical protein
MIRDLLKLYNIKYSILIYDIITYSAFENVLLLLKKIHNFLYRSINLKAWIDGEHGLDVKLSANLTNHIGEY